MGLFDKFKSNSSSGGQKMPVRFKTKVERKTATQDLVFDIEVKGFFVGKSGKPDFTPQEITVVGMPNMNMSGFFAKEIEEIRKHAIRVEYPRLLGMAPPAGR